MEDKTYLCIDLKRLAAVYSSLFPDISIVFVTGKWI